MLLAQLKEIKLNLLIGSHRRLHPTLHVLGAGLALLVANVRLSAAASDEDVTRELQSLTLAKQDNYRKQLAETSVQVSKFREQYTLALAANEKLRRQTQQLELVINELKEQMAATGLDLMLLTNLKSLVALLDQDNDKLQKERDRLAAELAKQRANTVQIGAQMLEQNQRLMRAVNSLRERLEQLEVLPRPR